MKHPNYEFIVAFAEGKEVEFKVKGLDGAWDKWEKVSTIGTFSTPDYCEFRIKPEKKRTVGYRRFIWKAHDGDYFVDAAINCFKDVENEDDFIKWIDTELQYEEVEE